MKGLKKFRLMRGWTQKELAGMLHVTRLTIARYESGARSPDIETARRLADALGCSLDELTGREHMETEV